MLYWINELKYRLIGYLTQSLPIEFLKEKYGEEFNKIDFDTDHWYINGVSFDELVWRATPVHKSRSWETQDKRRYSWAHAHTIGFKRTFAFAYEQYAINKRQKEKIISLQKEISMLKRNNKARELSGTEAVCKTDL